MVQNASGMEGEALVEAAREMAVRMHDACGHTRDGGGPYWQHPGRVEGTLRQCGAGCEVRAAAWLHDVAEDCPADRAGCEALLEDIGVRFGAAVAGLVREVTNFAEPGESMEVKQARLCEHAAHLSAGAKWIKLADRLDNVSGMSIWPAAKQARYAEATRRLLAALEPVPAGAEVLVNRIRTAIARLGG